MNALKTISFCFCFLYILNPVLAKERKIIKNVSYVDSSAADYSEKEHILDIYIPKNVQKNAKVLVFIHGGAWKNGSKDTPRHTAVGKAFSHNGLITVVINYRLKLGTKYYDMAKDCARAVVWVEKNIHKHGGDNNEIYVSGHSSGAHLAALISTDSSYLIDSGFHHRIKGCILNDAFGLNMFNYMATGNPVDILLFHATFTDLPSEWQKASPFYHVNKDETRYYMIYGGKTMQTVIDGSIEFNERNRYVGNISHIHKVKLRAHIPMLNLFCNKRNKELKKVLVYIGQIK